MSAYRDESVGKAVRGHSISADPGPHSTARIRLMCDERESQRTELNAHIDDEIRKGRRFTPEEALARMAGPGAMQGASPVSREQQAEIEIGSWLGNHLTDAIGPLKRALVQQLSGSELLLNNVDQPLVALANHCRRILASDELLKELVREADFEWGLLMDERPHFEMEGRPPDPDDPYTAESVRECLRQALNQLG